MDMTGPQNLKKGKVTLRFFVIFRPELAVIKLHTILVVHVHQL